MADAAAAATGVAHLRALARDEAMQQRFVMALLDFDAYEEYLSTTFSLTRDTLPRTRCHGLDPPDPSEHHHVCSSSRLFATACFELTVGT